MSVEQIINLEFTNGAFLMSLRYKIQIKHSWAIVDGSLKVHWSNMAPAPPEILKVSKRGCKLQVAFN